MTGRHPQIDVAVVGAGPTGCECARRLAEAGFSVLLTEEHERAGVPAHCTGIISAQAYHAFDLPQSAVHCELTTAEVTSPGGITLRVELNGARPLVIDRKQVDLELALRAQQAGVALCYETRVRHLETDRSGVTLSGTCARKPWEARARTAVLAVGAKSLLPRQVGLASSRDAMHGAQVEVPSSSPPTMRVWLGRSLAPGGFGWAVPAGAGLTKVGVLTRARPRDAVLAIADRALDGGAKPLRPEDVLIHPVPAAPRYPSSGNRVLSVGDAAGQVKMTTGGGVYYGLLGARIASEVLADRLAHGRVSARPLARYEALWQKMLGPEQRAGQALRRFASTVSDEALDDIFRAAEARGLSHQVVDLLDFDWHARPSLGLLCTVMAAIPGSGRGLRWLTRLMG